MSCPPTAFLSFLSIPTANSCKNQQLNSIWKKIISVDWFRWFRKKSHGVSWICFFSIIQFRDQQKHLQWLNIRKKKHISWENPGNSWKIPMVSASDFPRKSFMGVLELGSEGPMAEEQPKTTRSRPSSCHLRSALGRKSCRPKKGHHH